MQTWCKWLAASFSCCKEVRVQLTTLPGLFDNVIGRNYE
uniref:Uncharacterized protein n=1 Tax=Anguilla anguilla TaxID=7936 RepID=A0A0E9PYA0_ANGAN